MYDPLETPRRTAAGRAHRHVRPRPSPAAKPVTIPLTQDELAELVGGTRPSVNQVLRRFVDEGMVELGRGRIVVTDAAALRRAAAH